MRPKPVVAPEPEVVSGSLMRKVFWGFAVLAALSAAISAAGRLFGSTIAMAGYTDDASLREIVIGNDVVSAPANTIRFERARRDGVAPRLDLYLRWPSLDGFSNEARDDFNNVSGRKTIVFVAFEQRMMSRDMSGRFAPIYDFLIEKPGRTGPAELTVYDFTEKSGYMNEQLMVAPRPGGDPYVARCLRPEASEEALAPCERDIQVGSDLSVTYRFSRELLPEWRNLDAEITRKVARMIKTAG